MDGLVIALTLLVLAIAIAYVARRLRSTPTIGAAESAQRPAGDPGLVADLARSLGTTAKPVMSIQMRTTRSVSGGDASTETITIDGQTYHSIDEIPPEVRDRVRAMLAKARTPATGALPGGQAGLARIEQDLAALGLDVRGAPDPSADPGGGAREGTAGEPPKAG